VDVGDMMSACHPLVEERGCVRQGKHLRVERRSFLAEGDGELLDLMTQVENSESVAGACVRIPGTVSVHNQRGAV